jgi:putative restriction endonuclease
LYGVFVAFDIEKHAGQASTSPSIQVKESVLLAARDRAFSAYDRANGEIAVAFRPGFLGDYAVNANRLHKQRTAADELVRLLSELDRITDRQLEDIKDPERRLVVATIRRKYREADFRRRVLSAYAHKCAMCGLQLGLVEAAHILPVAAVGSTDDTTNGIALCALHHRAFDQGLVSFDERYKIEISSHRMGSLEDQKQVEGHSMFKSGLRPTLALPADPRDYPDPHAIAKSREVRLPRP